MHFLETAEHLIQYTPKTDKTDKKPRNFRMIKINKERTIKGKTQTIDRGTAQPRDPES
jgi:hypothetical protein